MSAPLARLMGRIGVIAVVTALVSLIGIQYARVIGRDVALAHDLRAAQRDVAALKVKRAFQAREIIYLKRSGEQP